MDSLQNIDAIVIGTSYGGLEALTEIFNNLEAGFTIPVIIVYHRAQNSDSVFLQDYFSRYTSQKIVEISDNETISKGYIYFAPVDYHILIENQNTIALSKEDPVNYSRPSIDLLFESASLVFKNRLLGILLTGANQDGASGLCAIATAGGFTVVQDTQEAISPVMPQSALDRCHVSEIATLKRIAGIMNLADKYKRI